MQDVALDPTDRYSPQPDALPVVSVIVPAYNAAQFIERTINSVSHQTYQQLEIVVVDDGSQDNTAQIVNQLAEKDPRIKLIRQQNAGVAAARNRGIAVSKGEFIAPVDADDLWHPENVEKQVSCLLDAGEPMAMTYAWTVDIDDKDCLTGNARASVYYGNIVPALLYSNVVGSGSASIIRRSSLETAGLFSSELRNQQAQGCEDWDIYLRIASQYEVGLIPEFLIGYRQVGNSMSTRKAEMTKSRHLALQPVAKQFPLPYRRVRRWSDALDYRFLAREYFNAGNTTGAWEALRQSFRLDPLMTVSTFSVWNLCSQLVTRSFTYWLNSNRNSKQSHAEEANPATHLVQPSNYAVRRPSRLKQTIAQAKVYLRSLLTAIFPDGAISTMRMRWVSSQVCPHRPFQKNVSQWKATRERARIGAQAKRGCRVNFNQDLPITSEQRLQAISSFGGELTPHAVSKTDVVQKQQP